MRNRPFGVPSPTRDELNQQLRIRRFLAASAVSALYLAVLLVFHTQDKVDRATLMLAVAIVTGFVGVFFTVFNMGANLRLADPSMTGLQVTAAIATMLFVFYRAPETRLVFAAFFCVALMFGMLRSSGRQLTIAGALALAAFGAVSVARHAMHGDGETLRMDILQLVVTAVAFPWFLYIGDRVRRLNEADRRKDDFLATLSHELRNPLAPIRAGIQLLHRGGAEAHPEVLPMMERQVLHLTRLLDDLLDVSRITRGKIALNIEQIDLERAVQAAVEANRPLVDKMAHELTVSPPPEPVLLDADPVRLAQVFSNLLNNAVKFTPRGGRIALKAWRDGDSVHVSVSDNGIGIPQEHLRSIFEMFVQIEGPGSQEGLGIGLAFVRGLVAMHGGVIEAHSEGPGRGSEFRVRLPVRGAAMAAAPER